MAARRRDIPIIRSMASRRRLEATITVIASSVSDEAIHSFFRFMDCFASLAMTIETGNAQMAKAAQAVGIATGQCLCGKVCFEIDTPARWAWHDHSAATRRAHGAAYATYVGSWRKR